MLQGSTTQPTNKLTINIKKDSDKTSSKNIESIDTSWEELVWSALMMGKGSISDLATGLDEGLSLYYDLQMRAYMMRAVIQKNTTDACLVKSSAYQEMETSEKTNASFWLGMFMTKLVAYKKDHIPFVGHFDYFEKKRRVVDVSSGLSCYLTQQD
jgi:hypothetical protein